MKTKSKSLLIAVAAFAVTTTGVYAHGGNLKSLEQAGLSEEQILAVQEAHELKKAGDVTEARDLLVEAGIDEEVLKEIHKGSKHKKHHRLLSELSDDQREALQVARQANDKETVEAILDEAGIERCDHKGNKE